MGALQEALGWCTIGTATSTASQIPGLRQIFSQTVINRLRQAGLQVRRPVRRNVLTVHHLAERLWWCLEHIGWRRVQWRTVLFSLHVQSRIYRRDNERYAANFVLEYDRFGDGSAVVGTGIHRDGDTAVVGVNAALNAQIYCSITLSH